MPCFRFAMKTVRSTGPCRLLVFPLLSHFFIANTSSVCSPPFPAVCTCVSASAEQSPTSCWVQVAPLLLRDGGRRRTCWTEGDPGTSHGHGDLGPPGVSLGLTAPRSVQHLRKKETSWSYACKKPLKKVLNFAQPLDIGNSHHCGA